MDRVEETGRHIKVSPERLARWREEALTASKEAEGAHPDEVKLVREFLDGIQFDVIRDMYRQINAASSGRGPTGTGTAAKLLAPHERVSRAKTNDFKKEDIVFAYIPEPEEDERGVKRGIPSLHYSSETNLIAVNLAGSFMKDLMSVKATSNEVLSDSKSKYRRLDVFTSFQVIFHELGHAYGYLRTSEHDTGRELYRHRQASVYSEQLQNLPGESENERRERMSWGNEYWMEAWNDLRAAFLMKEYLETGHSLKFDNVSLTVDDFDKCLYPHFAFSGYGPASIAVWETISHISEKQGVPFRTVFNSFTRIAQTKRGWEDLLEVLSGIFPDEIMRKMVPLVGGTPAGDLLSHEILTHLNAHPSEIEYIESVITSPGRFN